VLHNGAVYNAYPKMLVAVAMLAGGFGAMGCSKDNPLRETALGIVAAAATARSVSLAMDAIAGSAAACVQVSAACTSYPCSGGATVSIGSECPYPLGAYTGTVNVTGQWTSASDAKVQAQFVDVRETVSSDAFALVNVTEISATRTDGSVSVSYTGANESARSGLSNTAVGGSDSWTVDVNTQMTAAPGDDVLTLTATSASASAGLGTSAKTMTLSGVTLDPTCTLNPTAGSGDITEIQTFIPKITKIAFHAACDGTGSVNGDSYEFTTTP